MERERTYESYHYIPDGNVEPLTAKIEKLNKRARNLGVPEIRLLVGTPVETVVDADTGKVERSFPAIVVGDAPRFEGWALAAALVHVEDHVIIRSVPGWDIPPVYRSAKAADCDHCHTIRRRTDTFIVSHDDGRWAHVGRNCLADFLGNRNPHDLATWAELIFSASEIAASYEEAGFGGGHIRDAWRLDKVVALASAVIREVGWVPVSKAGYDELPTRAHVIHHLTCSHKNCGKGAHPTPGDYDLKAAGEAIEWAAGLDGGSDYEYNLATLTKLESIDLRMIGLAASIIPAHARVLERELKAKRAGLTSHHFGEVGKRAVFDLTVESTHAIAGNYGVTTIIKFVDAAGNVAAWFASGDRVEEFEIGKVVKLTATVKRHESYKGIAETHLSRGVVEPSIGDEVDFHGYRAHACRRPTRAVIHPVGEIEVGDAIESGEGYVLEYVVDVKAGKAGAVNVTVARETYDTDLNEYIAAPVKRRFKAGAIIALAKPEVAAAA